jgi:hypothetical protein
MGSGSSDPAKLAEGFPHEVVSRIPDQGQPPGWLVRMGLPQVDNWEPKGPMRSRIASGYMTTTCGGHLPSPPAGLL